MRIQILIIFVFTLFNCTKKKASVKPPIVYYFIENNGRYISESNYADIVRRVNDDFKLVETKVLEYKKSKITIKKLSNLETAAIDGAVELFYLDTLLIYERSESWTNSYCVLQSNNDSINKLVNFSLASIMGNPSMFYPEHTKFMFDELNKLKSQKK